MSKQPTYTELDQALRDLALTDWPRFVKMMGQENINKAKICLMRQNKRTINYMSFRVKMPRSTVGDACKRCPEQ